MELRRNQRLTSIHAKPASQTAVVHCQVTRFFVSGPGRRQADPAHRER